MHASQAEPSRAETDLSLSVVGPESTFHACTSGARPQVRVHHEVQAEELEAVAVAGRVEPPAHCRERDASSLPHLGHQVALHVSLRGAPPPLAHPTLMHA